VQAKQLVNQWQKKNNADNTSSIYGYCLVAVVGVGVSIYLATHSTTISMCFIIKIVPYLIRCDFCTSFHQQFRYIPTTPCLYHHRQLKLMLLIVANY